MDMLWAKLAGFVEITHSENDNNMSATVSAQY